MATKLYDNKVQFRCDGGLKNAFMRQCERNNQVPADVHRRLMERYATGTLSVAVKK